MKGKLLSAGKYDYSVSYEVGKGYYRDLAPELRWDLADRASGGVPEALRYVGDEAVIQIMEERFFVYEKGEWLIKGKHKIPGILEKPQRMTLGL